MPQTLRDYQKEALTAIDRQWERGYSSTIVSLFTGLGKTNVFIEDVYRRMKANPSSRVLIIGPAHLTSQTYGRFLTTYPALFDSLVQVQHQRFKALGMEMSNRTDPAARAVVGSVPTLIDRDELNMSTRDEDAPESKPITYEDFDTTIWGGVKLADRSRRKYLVSKRVDTLLQYGLFDYVIYDETHHAVGDGSLVLITRLREITAALRRAPAKLVGYTATAWREDGRALGTLFETIAIHRGYDFGVKNGYLAPIANNGLPIKVHAEGIGEKTAGIKATDWMYVLEEAWLEKARQIDGELRPTVAYFPSVEDSEDFATFMRERGHNAAHVDGVKTIDGTGERLDIERGREKMINDVFTGKTRLVCNYAVFLEGTDVKPWSCILWGRPTDNAVVTTQAIGRVLRLFDGNAYLPPKEDALILDAAGKQMSIIASGTLAGVRVDPYGEYVKDEVVDKEVVVEGLDGLDVRDLKKPGQAQTSKGVSYSFGTLIKRSGSDWYHDERYDVMSLGISETETLIITPPHYTFQTHLATVQSQLEAQMVARPDDGDLRKEYIAVAELAQMLGGYSLWAVSKGRPVDGFLFYSPGLDETFDFATLYINTTEDSVGAFYKRSRKWRSEPMTQNQEHFLRLLGVKGDISHYTKGEAAQQITHIEAYDRNLAPYLAKRLKTIKKYLPTKEKVA